MQHHHVSPSPRTSQHPVLRNVSQMQLLAGHRLQDFSCVNIKYCLSHTRTHTLTSMLSDSAIFLLRSMQRDECLIPIRASRETCSHFDRSKEKKKAGWMRGAQRTDAPPSRCPGLLTSLPFNKSSLPSQTALLFFFFHCEAVRRH